MSSRCIHDLFEAKVAQSPDALAVVCGEESCTYSDLDRRANRIACALRASGAGPEVLVGLCIERSIEMVAAILGILKAGSAYVPLDPSYPPERLSLLLADSQAPIVVTQDALVPRLPAGMARVLRLDRDVAPGGEASAPESSASPENAAYIIYTSGSTGVPKGVVVEHRQVARLFESTARWFGFDRSDVWTMFHSFGFDFSVWEIWGALLFGGRMVIVPHDVSRNPERFHDLLAHQGVTVLNQTPSAFHQLSRVEEARGKVMPPSLRWIIFGGEALDPKMLRGWVSRHGVDRPRLINMYGITETTVHVTFRPITRADVEHADGSPIGIPIPDLSLYLLDEHGAKVAPGSPGEIYVGGAGVARGYLRRPELDRQRFLSDPFSETPGARMYRSGDLAVQRGGDLWYLGRGDGQLKIRGFRIEPGEVESFLRGHQGVSDAVVVGRDHDHGDQKLLAYIVPRVAHNAHGAVLVEDLRALAALRLPEHMRPSSYVLLEALPLNANGKVDRRALPAPEQADDPRVIEAQLPSTALELRLAALWAEVLGVKTIGIDDDFFDQLGGTSLGAINVLLLIQEQMGTALDMSIWGTGATIRHFARALSGEGAPGQMTS